MSVFFIKNSQLINLIQKLLHISKKEYFLNVQNSSDEFFNISKLHFYKQLKIQASTL